MSSFCFPNTSQSTRRTILFCASFCIFSLRVVASTMPSRSPLMTRTITQPNASPSTSASGNPPMRQYTCRSISAKTGVSANVRKSPSRPTWWISA